ncbi:AP2/ERF family transcription factor [Desulfurivibrio sp. C05AmB]|uniref:AP2/ERF family transcription factor n=1 Tax=Desulfurivibrio sp. C05AmB TaxID=3374371 RepID=UPI00376EB9CB
MRKKHKYVVRIDQESKRTYGWFVRVYFMGKTHTKFFSDGKHGGRNSSLRKALAWRDQTEISLGKVRTERHIVSVSNTSTGVVGVRHNEKLNRYEVSWVTQEGKQGKTSISIRKHGKEKAFELACRIRQEKEAERLGLEKTTASRRRLSQKSGAPVTAKTAQTFRATKTAALGEKTGSAPKSKPAIKAGKTITAKPAPKTQRRS